MSEFLFVSPPTPSPAEHSEYSVMAPPLGIGYVAACLRQAGYSVAAVDLAVSNNPLEDMKNAILREDPRIIGFYTLTQSYYATEFLVAHAKALSPDAVMWVGGPHVSYEVEAALKQSGFDVVFLFEAEESAVEAAECTLRGKGDLRQVKGIAFLEDGAVIKTPPRTREKVLDVVPYPARDLFPIHQYYRPGTIMSSRGCPLKCIFCIASTFEDAYRYRSPENVIGEMREMYEQWGINDFYFVDNVFTTHRARAREICKILRRLDLPVGWYCVSRVDYVSPVLMQDLASAGCYRIELGVEAADLSVIDTMKKRITLEQVRRAADIILNLGMQPMFTFQVGHPDDTLETIEATLELIEELRDRGCGTYLSVTTPYPGTPLLIGRDKYEITMESWNWEDFRMSNPTYSTKHFSQNDVRRAVYREALSLQRALKQGKVKDPRLAPWVRFAADGSGKGILPPPPPPEDDKARPLKIATRRADSPDKVRSLPVLQVDRQAASAQA